ncbi:c-type cytochrome [Azomonas macrocytogenes]|uniref:Mono/diheme cytochrome c family protein n=1 Tax=Azomonas macrocytogenes TaxID=69962 RepID=A0A839TAV9_AZOMA|nr:cytochrome c [Azomonas macrocytogenes]MBB3104753.1 mono/diheme cytochrome c family protein [Azomonas macrocytogenes]
MSTGLHVVGLAMVLGIASAQAASSAGQCPEPRETQDAPPSYLTRVNPLPKTAENLAMGRRLYESDARPAPCIICHGAHGDGRSPAAEHLVPPPRNFRCAQTMDAISDGQLYWVIEKGAGDLHYPARQGAQHLGRPGRSMRITAMRSYGEYLTEVERWQLVLYIRALAQEDQP